MQKHLYLGRKIAVELLFKLTDISMTHECFFLRKRDWLIEVPLIHVPRKRDQLIVEKSPSYHRDKSHSSVP